MKKTLTLLGLIAFCAASFAHPIAVSTAPNDHAETAFLTQSSDHLMPIYKNQNGWTKVGNTLTGDIGWIKNDVLASQATKAKPIAKKIALNKMPQKQYEQTFELKKPHKATLRYSGTQNITQEDAEKMLEKMELEQKMLSKRMQAMHKHMQDLVAQMNGEKTNKSNTCHHKNKEENCACH